MSIDDSVSENIVKIENYVYKHKPLTIFEDAIGSYILCKIKEKENKYGIANKYNNKAIKHFREILTEDKSWIINYYNLIVKKYFDFEKINNKTKNDKLNEILKDFYDAWHVKNWDYENNGLSPAYKELAENYIKKYNQELIIKDNIKPGLFNK